MSDPFSYFHFATSQRPLGASAKSSLNRVGMTVTFVTYLLVVIFGSTSWLSTNSIWMELPLLTQQLPEGWSLPSYLAAVVQLACIGPLFYSIVHKCSNYTIPTAPTIQILLVFCTAITAALAFLWPVTVDVLGTPHSLALLVIMFCMALVNATSNVLFMPYMSMYHPSYLTAYFVGMGLSSLVPSLVSLVQGTGRYDCVQQNTTGVLVPEYYPSRFDVTTFNLVMFGWMSLATVSFALLHWTPLGGPKELKKNKSAEGLPPDEASPLQPKEKKTHTYARYFTLLFLVAFNCAQMNGIVPSIQSFAMLPYSQMTYHLALTLSNIASPIAGFMPMLYTPKTVFSMSMFTGVATFFTGLIVTLAASSPDPIGREYWWGGAFAILCSVVASSMHSYLRTVFAHVVMDGAEDKESRLFWCGVFIQVGSFIGSCIMFPLVNVYGLFISAPACR
uniref:Riboflavin transporter n=1 Tax=Steinernema glaseri TaxID=37863 RepID=A0A1I7YAJ3_9BILA